MLARCFKNNPKDNFTFNLHFGCEHNNMENKCDILEDSTTNEHDSKITIPKAIQDRVFTCKSVNTYKKWHNKFENYINENNKAENFESILEIFNDMSKHYASSTLWQGYSCLNKYYNTYKGWKSFNEIPILKNLLKTIEKESKQPKKSLILSKEDLLEFLEKEEEKSLVRKAVAAIGYYGGMRCNELMQLSQKQKDIKIDEEKVTVVVRSSKTDPQGKKQFYFTIPKSVSNGIPYKTVLEYMNVISSDSDRFFQNFNKKSQKYCGQPMGRNNIAGVPKYIAKSLGLEEPEKYTGHCLRRSSATAFADSGATSMALKRQFRWKSETVAQGYLDQSKSFKMDVANSLSVTKISGNGNQSGLCNKNDRIINFTNCSNIVVNL